MTSRAIRRAWAVLAVGVLSPGLGVALVRVDGHGRWPDSWPKELEPYRNQAKTVGVHHGIQEMVYEIEFNSREDFEKAWPHVLKLKGKGGRLILDSSPSKYDVSGSEMGTGVRVLWPAGGVTRDRDGNELQTGGPWPDSVKSPSGELPEYVVVQDGKWVPFDGTNRRGFMHRARVDIILVTDGEIVDLNRIRLPADTPIIDKRELGPAEGNVEGGAELDSATP